MFTPDELEMIAYALNVCEDEYGFNGATKKEEETLIGLRKKLDELIKD
jgi:hypothetical protein